MRLFRTIFLAVLAILSVTITTLVLIEGNLSFLIGYTAFGKGERLFPYSGKEMSEISWMRVADTHGTAEAYRLPSGVWWMSKPWNDRMDPRAAAAILNFTYSTSIIDALPMNNTVRNSMREFGVETNPVHITLKKTSDDGDSATTLARYTLGSTAPWKVDDPTIKDKTDDTTYMQCDYYGRNNRILVGTGNILELFKNGLSLLRDHRPFLLAPLGSADPNQPQEISIRNKKQPPVVLTRESLQSPWLISAPLPLKANLSNVANLVNNLQLLAATKVYDAKDISLPNYPQDDLVKITVRTFTSKDPVTLTIYPPDSPNSSTVKATVSNRQAVFDLSIKGNQHVPGVRDIPMYLAQLRSPYLMEINRSKLVGISIRGKDRNGFPLILRLQEGDKNHSVSSRWYYSAEGNNFTPASEEQLFNLLTTLISCPVVGAVSDNPSDPAIYGLANPEYTITIGYKPQEPPITPQTLFIGQGADKSTWYASIDSKPSVYQIGDEFMQAIRMDDLSWHPRKLFNFSRLNLKKITTTETGKQPLALAYDHLFDSWSATRNGEDVTRDINPNRARYYLNALEKMHVDQWLPYTDQNAARALEHPTFTLRLDMEEKIGEDERLNVIEQPDNNTFTQLPIPEEKISRKSVILEIAPSRSNYYYYGRISTSPYYFMLDATNVKLLYSSVYEQ